MNQMKIKQWLNERQLVCEKNFGEALYKLAVEYSDDTGSTMSKIWKELGISKQNINFWLYHHKSAASQLNIKRDAIKSAQKLFSLSKAETRELANKAGLGMLRGDFDVKNNKSFSVLFSEKLKQWGGKQRDLYESAGIHKRTFYSIKSGTKLRKESLLALLIVMDLNLSEIQNCLESAGYVLSPSCPSDLLISYLLENDLKEAIGVNKLNAINNLLYDLDEPLLQVRTARE